MEATIIWLLIAVVAIVLDIVTSAFLFVWFSLGAFAALIANLLGLNYGMQIVIFAVVSLISILIGYPWAKKKYKKSIKRTPLMEESYIGKIIVAEEDIIDMARIKVGGIYWTGVNRGTMISKGQKYKIIGIEGNKFIIEGVKVEEE